MFSTTARMRYDDVLESLDMGRAVFMELGDEEGPEENARAKAALHAGDGEEPVG